MAAAAAELEPTSMPGDGRPVCGSRHVVHIVDCRASHTATFSTAATRRRRRLLPLALLLVALLTLTLTQGQGDDPGSAEQLSATDATGLPEAMVVLGPGETVWDLALAYAPAGENVQQWVAEVVAQNGGDARKIQPGTALRIPVY